MSPRRTAVLLHAGVAPRDATNARQWRPGWRTGVADNIAATSDVPDTRKRRHARRAKRALFRVLLAFIGLVALLSHFN